MRPLAPHLAVAAALALAAGCAAPPSGSEPLRPRPSLAALPPAPATPEPVTLTPRPVASGERFAIDLAATLSIAGAGSYEIALARERTNEAAAQALRLDEGFLPWFGPEALGRTHDGRVQRSTGQFVDDVDKQQVFGGVGASARVDLASGILGALAGLRREDAARADLAATEEDVLVAAACAYFELVGRTADVDVARRALAEARGFLREREALYARGAPEGLKVDVLRARAEVATNERDVVESEAAADRASVELARILGIEPTARLVPVEARPAPVSFVHGDEGEAALIRRALAARPEIARAEALVRAASSSESAATWGPLVPSVEVDASSGGFGPHPTATRESDDVAAFVGWRVGPGGLLDVGAMRETAARTARARIELARARDGVEADVVTALLGERAARARMASAATAMAAADEALRLSRERVRQGVAIVLEVLDAERVAALASFESVAATVAFDQAAYRLFRAIGETPPAR